MRASLDSLKDLGRVIRERTSSLLPRVQKKEEPSVAPSEPKTDLDRFCNPDDRKPCITVCSPASPCECDCESVRRSLVRELEERRIPRTVGRAKTGCGGSCKSGPFIGFPQRGFFYLGVRPEDVPEIVRETVLGGKILFPFLSVNPDRAYRSDILFEKETGMLAAIHEGVCMVETAKYFLDFDEGLSCGKCAPCRIGMKRMQEIMERVVSGNGTLPDMEQIRILCATMRETPHCEFAVTSSRPVLSALTYFEDEFLAHIEGKECPAGVCRELVELQRKKAVRQRLMAKKR